MDFQKYIENFNKKEIKNYIITIEKMNIKESKFYPLLNHIELSYTEYQLFNTIKQISETFMFLYKTLNYYYYLYNSKKYGLIIIYVKKNKFNWYKIDEKKLNSYIIYDKCID